MIGEATFDEGLDALVVTFRYRPDVKDMVKGIRGARFDWTSKTWRFARADAADAARVLAGHGFALDAAAAALLDGVPPGPEGVDDDPEGDGYSISQLNDEASRALARHFTGDVWVVGEIDGWGRARQRDHAWFELVERSAEGGVAASVSAVLFRNARARVEAAFERAGLELEDGLRVRLRCRVDLYVRRGTFQLIIEDVDAAWSAGTLAARREQILAQLDADGLRERNASLPMPSVPLRVALLTSAGSDAYRDVVTTLQASRWGFDVTVFDVRVQGDQLESTVVGALALVGAHADRFDVCIVSRGGGSRVELGAWDNLAVARAVARCPVKVMVAIGHERDRGVLDEIAMSCRTPTEAARVLVGYLDDAAVAVDMLGERLDRGARRTVDTSRARLLATARGLDARTRGRLATEQARVDTHLPGAVRRAVRGRSRAAEARVDALQRATARAATARPRAEHARLSRAHARIERSAVRPITTAAAVLERAVPRLERAAAAVVRAARRDLEPLATAAEHADPRRLLARGFAIVRTADGRAIADAAALIVDDNISVQLRDGTIDATVTARHRDPGEET